MGSVVTKGKAETELWSVGFCFFIFRKDDNTGRPCPQQTVMTRRSILRLSTGVSRHILAPSAVVPESRGYEDGAAVFHGPVDSLAFLREQASPITGKPKKSKGLTVIGF